MSQENIQIITREGLIKSVLKKILEIKQDVVAKELSRLTDDKYFFPINLTKTKEDLKKKLFLFVVYIF